MMRLTVLNMPYASFWADENAQFFAPMWRLPHVPVQRAAFKQLRLRALGCSSAVPKHHDVVRIFGGGQTVGDHQQRLALRQRRDALLDLVFVFRVGKCGGLVQNDDRRIFKHHAGDGDALFFAAGQPPARLSGRGIIALRQFPNELLALRRAPQPEPPHPSPRVCPAGCSQSASSGTGNDPASQS